MTLDHLGNGVLAGEIHASNVDGHDLIPGLNRRVDDRMVGLRHDPGVVVEDVETAERLDRQVRHGLRVGFDGDIGDDRHRLAACGADLADGFLGGLAVIVGHHHARSLGREPEGGHAPHAAARAGDDRNLVLESHARLLAGELSRVGPGHRFVRHAGLRTAVSRLAYLPLAERADDPAGDGA